MQHDIQITPRMALSKRLKVPLIIGGTILGAVLLAGAAMMARMNYVPANLDYSTTRTSNAGLYKLSYTPSTTPIPINRLHTWTLHLETPEGQPIDNAELHVDGDMPQHGHGLPTHPVVSQHLGNGDYLVEGMKFQMGGWWVMDFEINVNGTTDTAHFNMVLR